jgi:Ser/Thr protein kinase RdoA (MazF antagonist)
MTGRPDHEPVRDTVAPSVERLLGAKVVAERPIGGGYTYAGKRVAELADGRSVFVKAAFDELTRDWLRSEHRIYESVSGPFMPRFLGWEDEQATVLVLEDLSGAAWPPPWSPERIDAVQRTLADLHQVTPPLGSRRPDEVDDLRGGWRTVAEDPEPFLSLRVCSRSWLTGALPSLLAAADRAPLDGDSLIHLDVHSNNICFNDERCLLVDWSSAAQGNPLLDLAVWLPSLHVEGGPEPDAFTGDGLGELAAVFAGYLACRAGLPEPASAPPPGVRSLQLDLLRVALPWAARQLGIAQS